MAARVCPKCQQTVDGDEPFCPRDGTRLLKRSVYEQIAASSDPLVGQRVSGRYLVIRKLGEGGMGDVFLAEHEDIEKRLALKVLKYEYSTRPDVVQRFKQEAVSASRIKHPNVVDVFDFGQLDDGRFFLAMELLEGRDLADVLAVDGSLDPRRAVRIGLQLARALAAAHAKGVVHRDMKPENVFLTMTDDGEEIVKILDFGIAKLRDLGGDQVADAKRKLTKTGMIFGTPEYMAPEQAAGKPIDDKVDVYATGVILYELLVGKVPFWGETFMAVLTAHLTEPPPDMRMLNPRLQISPELEEAVLGALRKEPVQRHPSMVAFAEALARSPEANLDIPIPLARPANAADRAARAAEAAMRDVPRVDGELATATTEPVPVLPAPKRRAWGPLIGLAAVALGAGGAVVVAVWLGMGSNELVVRAPVSGTTVGTSSTPSSSSVPARSSSPSPAWSPSNSALVVAEPEGSVVIHVETRPPGAVIKKREGDSWFQVCPATPCDYPARADEKVELVAELGALRGQGSVLARTAQTVVIQLVSPRANGTSTGGGTRTDQCEFCVPKGDPDCIKVLRPCGKPP